MAIYVLIHGSWHGGWCWRKAASLLRLQGHQVYAPSLVGMGELAHLSGGEITLAAHVQQVASLLFYENLHEVILVGHSYGGMVITGAAALGAERLSQLVYLDAYLPQEGQSEYDLWAPEEQAAARRELAEGRKFRPLPPPELLGITAPDQVAWVNARLTPHPLSTYFDPPPPATAQSAALRRVYIHCTLGRIGQFTRSFKDRARAEGWEVWEMDTGHDVMVTHPVELVSVLLEIARQE